MDHLLYISMSGAQAAMQRQDVLANNLANVNTTGFRAEVQAFRAVPVRGDGATTRAFALESTIGYDPTPGPVEQTGRSLDVALRGNAWLAVQNTDGTESYTRDGALQIDSTGQLVTGRGLPVAGDGGAIQVPPNATVAIASDGTISAQVGNARPQLLGRLKLVTPEAPLQKQTDGLFKAADGNDLGADATARLQAGALEGSNVNPVSAMVAMISAARQFEQQMKSIQQVEQREQNAAKLLAPQ